MSDFDDEPIESVLVEVQPAQQREPSDPVANQFPTVTIPSYRLAIIGGSPSRDDIVCRSPFNGASGRMLSALLGKANILRSACYMGNVCQHPAEGYVLDPNELAQGLEVLADDLANINPNLCFLLGRDAFKSAKVDGVLDNWRGSVFIGDKPGPFFGRKCLASYHPSDCFRQYDWTTLLMFDIRKAAIESKLPDHHVPYRDLRTDLSLDALLSEMDKVLDQRPTISIDIEGGIYGMSCISIAPSPTFSFIVPFERRDGTSYWSFEEEMEVWRKLAAILAHPGIPKILQNSLYDRFVLQYAYKIVVHGIADDTMLKHWELYCELEKGLGFLCSLYTKEPFYKGDRKADDGQTFYRYCCKDSAVTYEISNAVGALLDHTRVSNTIPNWQARQVLLKQSFAHYRFNMALLNPILYMELKGIKYDTAKAKAYLAKVNDVLFVLQYRLNKIANCMSAVPTLAEIQSLLCYKRDPNQPKKGNESAYAFAKAMLANAAHRPLTETELGRLSVELGLSMNTKSPAFKTLLYERLGLPKQYKKDPKTGVERLSTDYEALLKIRKAILK